jgi:hypothetical protein
VNGRQLFWTAERRYGRPKMGVMLASINNLNGGGVLAPRRGGSMSERSALSEVAQAW